MFARRWGTLRAPSFSEKERLLRISATSLVVFLREHAVLVVAAVAAAASALAVPPDEAYLGYFDWKTLGCLFCMLAVASALRLMGAFDRAARAVIARFRSPGPSRAGPRAHDGRALVCGNQRHGPHHDAAAVRRHAHRRGACASRGARVRAAEPGSEPLRHDHALRQPAEPVSVLLLWAAPRRFPAHDGVALRAVDRWRRRLHLVVVRSAEQQPQPKRCAQARRAHASQSAAPCRLRAAARPHPPGRVPHRAHRHCRRHRGRDARRPRPPRAGRRGLGPARHLCVLLRVRGKHGRACRKCPHGFRPSWPTTVCS